MECLIHRSSCKLLTNLDSEIWSDLFIIWRDRVKRNCNGGTLGKMEDRFYFSQQCIH